MCFNFVHYYRFNEKLVELLSTYSADSLNYINEINIFFLLN